MSSQLNNNKIIMRYKSDKVVEHLASNYVLGLLNARVVNRINKLCLNYEYHELQNRINFWEQKLSPLDEYVPVADPDPSTFSKISEKLNFEEPNAQEDDSKSTSFSTWLEKFSIWKLSSAFSIALCAILAFTILQQPEQLGPLSYVAVLEGEDKSPQLVASTYGDAQTLVLDIIDLPALDEEQTYELWVVSKTDNQIRSLGEVPTDTKSFDRL